MVTRYSYEEEVYNVRMEIPTRALILAAGLGTRLRPLTNEIPKCLVEVCGQSVLDRWLENLEKSGCDKVIVNTHHHAKKVRDVINIKKYKRMEIQEKYEDTLLGTAGTLLQNLKFFENTLGILIHADNICDISLNELIAAHKKKPAKCIITMLTFSCDEPSKFGIVEVDQEGVGIDFHEKVRNPPGNIANGAIYIFDNDFIDFAKKLNDSVTDFSTQVIPKLTGKINTLHTHKAFVDIGTQENLKKANILWSQKEKGNS